jgi:uncharacterized protein YndB with AHSA1/START domain
MTFALVSIARGEDHTLRHTAIINAPVEKVWDAFASTNGLRSWIAPNADFDLRIGGKMRVNYHPDGVLGDANTIENTILSFEPLRMLSLRATRAPAGFPFANAIKGTWSVMYFERQGKSHTRLTISGLGYTDDAESQQMRSFFDWGNDATFQQLNEMFAGKASPDDRNANNRSVPVSQRQLVKEVTVAGSLAAVWHAWTTNAGAKAFFAKQPQIELTPGGTYNMHFFPDKPVGQKGAEGCNVLTFLPMQMLAFDWSAPPSIPALRNSGAKAQVIVELTPVGPSNTRIRLTHTGFGSGADWEKYYDYFDKAWDTVLGKFKTTLDHHDTRMVRADETWVDGATIVSIISHPAKRQDFEITVPASTGDVWKTLTTPAGIKTFFATDATIELKPGGKYDLHEGTPNTVMAFIPNRMLAVTGSAPPQFPNVRKGGTWAVIYLDKIGDKKTRIRMASVGWKEGDAEFDAAYDYFLKANATFMNMLHRRFVEGPV